MRNATWPAALALSISTAAFAQAPGKWPPDSLINTRVIPKTTLPIQVVGTMRNFAGDLGVRKAASRFYGEGRNLTTDEVRALGQRFDPFQNLTAHYLLAGLLTGT